MFIIAALTAVIALVSNGFACRTGGMQAARSDSCGSFNHDRFHWRSIRCNARLFTLATNFLLAIMKSNKPIDKKKTHEN
jgi:hypothetical protein